MKQKEWVTVIVVAVVSSLITFSLAINFLGSPVLGSPAEGAPGNYVGIQNRVAKWMNATTLTNSVIYDNGRIGIGTPSPSADSELQINSLTTNKNADLRLQSSSGQRWNLAAVDIDGSFRVAYVGSTYKDYIKIQNDGNITLPGNLTVGGRLKADYITMAGPTALDNSWPNPLYVCYNRIDGSLFVLSTPCVVTI